MPKAFIEHANLTVSDPDRSAALFEKLFGWRERWRGAAMLHGWSLHVGDERSYIALYTGEATREAPRYRKGLPLNHIGFVVDDLDAAQAIVEQAGLEPFGLDDYFPGRRFYFFDWDGIEFELVCYG